MLDDPFHDAEVTQTQSDMITGTGKVVIDAVGPGSSVQYIRVELYIDAGGWSCGVNPSSITAPAGGGEFPIDYFVTVPSSTETGTYTFTISGRAIPIPPGVRQSMIPDTVGAINVTGVEGAVPEDKGERLTDVGNVAYGRIDGDNVAWLDERGTLGDENDLWIMDTRSGSIRHLINDTMGRAYIGISGDRIVFLEDESENITYYDLDEDRVVDIDPGLESNPAASPYIDMVHYNGDTIAFIAYEYNDVQDIGGMDSDAFGYDLAVSASTRFSDSQQTSRNYEGDAVTDGEYVVYSTWDAGDMTEITTVDLFNGDVVSLEPPTTQLAGPYDMDQGIVTFVNWATEDVTYLDVETGLFADIGLDGYDWGPRVGDGRIVWMNEPYDETDVNIFLYDINTRSTTKISEHPAGEYSPDISKSTVICLSDRGSGSDLYAYHLDDLDLNSPPNIDLVTAEPAIVIPDGISTIRVQASDPDGDALTFEYNATGGAIEGSGSIVTWLAPSEEGSYVITARAYDGLSWSEPSNVTVVVDAEAPEEHPPVIDSVDASAYSTEPGGEVDIDVTAHDDDGDVLQYMYEADGGEFESGGELTSADSDRWYAPDDEGTYTLTVTAYDGMYYSAPEEVEVEVTEGPGPEPGDNNAPRIDDIDADPSPVEGGTVAVITVDAHDEDGDELMYSYSAEAGTIAADGDTAEWLAPDADGKYTITVTVEDPYGASDEDDIDVRVYVGNKAPRVVSAGIDMTSAVADDSTLVVFRAQVADDNGLEDILSVTADLSGIDLDDDQELQDNGRNGDEQAGDGIYSHRFTVPLGVDAGNYSATVTVEDTAGDTDTYRATFEVVAPKDGGGSSGEEGEEDESTPGFEVAAVLGAALAALLSTAALSGRRRKR